MMSDCPGRKPSSPNVACRVRLSAASRAVPWLASVASLVPTAASPIRADQRSVSPRGPDGFLEGLTDRTALPTCSRRLEARDRRRSAHRRRARAGAASLPSYREQVLALTVFSGESSGVACLHYFGAVQVVVIILMLSTVS